MNREKDIQQYCKGMMSRLQALRTLIETNPESDPFFSCEELIEEVRAIAEGSPVYEGKPLRYERCKNIRRICFTSPDDSRADQLTIDDPLGQSGAPPELLDANRAKAQGLALKYIDAWLVMLRIWYDDVTAADGGQTAKQTHQHNSSTDLGHGMAPTAPNQTSNDDDEMHNTVEDCLFHQSLGIYRFLRKRKHWTDYDSLRSKDELWRKSNPDNSTIVRALKRLQTRLNEITGAPSLAIDNKAGRAKLDKPSTE